MNYYQHIPQLTPGLGAAFYSPSEYLNKPTEFPISSIRLIGPSLLQPQPPAPRAPDRDRQDAANIPSPPSSSEAYADADVSNKRYVSYSAFLCYLLVATLSGVCCKPQQTSVKLSEGVLLLLCCLLLLSTTGLFGGRNGSIPLRRI